MGIAERAALAVCADDLAWSELGVRPVDCVAALSAASGLGSDILRAKDYDAFALKRAVLQLTAKAMVEGRKRRLPLSRAQAQAFAVLALQEILHPQCRQCNGAAVIVAERAVRHICPKCGGTGIHRYSDAERERLAGVPRGKWGVWESRYRLVMRIARVEDCAPMQAKDKLG